MEFLCFFSFSISLIFLPLFPEIIVEFLSFIEENLLGITLFDGLIVVIMHPLLIAITGIIDGLFSIVNPFIEVVHLPLEIFVSPLGLIQSIFSALSLLLLDGLGLFLSDFSVFFDEVEEDFIEDLNHLDLSIGLIELLLGFHEVYLQFRGHIWVSVLLHSS